MWEEAQREIRARKRGSGREWESGWRLKTAYAESQLCPRLGWAGPLGLIQTLKNEDRQSLCSCSTWLPAQHSWFPTVRLFQR